MRIINVVPEMSSLQLGRVGENERTQFVFDVSELLEEYPGAEIELLNQLPYSNEVYKCEISTPDTDGKVTWTITSTETAVKGKGCCQLMATKNTAIAKSMAWDTKIEKGLIPPADPDPEQEAEQEQNE